MTKFFIFGTIIITFLLFIPLILNFKEMGLSLGDIAITVLASALFGCLMSLILTGGIIFTAKYTLSEEPTKIEYLTPIVGDNCIIYDHTGQFIIDRGQGIEIQDVDFYKFENSEFNPRIEYYAKIPDSKFIKYFFEDVGTEKIIYVSAKDMRRGG